MSAKLKRAITTVAGILFLILGVIGLVLPFLQGLLFLFIGIVLLSLVSTRIRRWMEVPTRKHPALHRIVERTEAWVERLLGLPK